MFDLRHFTLHDMSALGSELRSLGEGAETMEEVASGIVRHLYAQLVDPETGAPSCALVRFFKTHPCRGLSQELERAALGMLAGEPPRLDMPCLTLLGTVGDEPAWNDVARSRGHRVIPLASKEMVSTVPMISSLLQQLGVEIEALWSAGPNLLVEQGPSTFNVFYVPEATGSPFIPAQAEFVRPRGIRSVLGFGGMLTSGDIFVVILFSKVAIPRETAELFRTLALNVKLAVLSLESAVFAPRAEPVGV